MQNVFEDLEEIKRMMLLQQREPPVEEAKSHSKMIVSAQPQKRQLEPMADRIRTDEELLDYLVMKAVDAYDRMDDEEEPFLNIP